MQKNENISSQLFLKKLNNFDNAEAFFTGIAILFAYVCFKHLCGQGWAEFRSAFRIPRNSAVFCHSVPFRIPHQKMERNAECTAKDWKIN